MSAHDPKAADVDTSVDGGDLAPETARFLDGLFRAYAPDTEDLAPEIVTDAEWVAYLSGALAAEEAYSLTRRVAADAGLRAEMRRVYRQLEALRNRPLATAESAPVAELWRSLVARLSGEYIRTARERMRGARERVWASGEAGEAGVLRSAFREDFRRLRAEAAQTARTLPPLALARSGDVTANVVYLPVVNAERTAASVRRAVVDADGTATLSVTWEGAVPEGATVFLGMRGAAGGWLLASAPCAGGATTWIVGQLGTALSLGPGPLPTDGFYLSVGNFADPPGEDAITLPATVVGPDGAPIGDALLERRSVRVEEGRLWLTLVVPEAVRRRYPQASVALDLRLGHALTQRLDSWPLAEWEMDAREVSLPLPSPDAAASLLIALLVATVHEPPA